MRYCLKKKLMRYKINGSNYICFKSFLKFWSTKTFFLKKKKIFFLLKKHKTTTKQTMEEEINKYKLKTTWVCWEGFKPLKKIDYSHLISGVMDLKEFLHNHNTITEFNDMKKFIYLWHGTSLN